MAGAATTDFFVGGIFRDAACIANSGAVNPFNLPESSFGAPEAPHTEERCFVTVGKRGGHGRAEHKVLGGDRHCLIATRKCLVSAR